MLVGTLRTTARRYTLCFRRKFAPLRGLLRTHPAIPARSTTGPGVRNGGLAQTNMKEVFKMATATTVMEPNVKISATKLLINNQWVNSVSGKTFPTINPSTGEVITQVAESDAADVDKAVTAARAAFDKGPWKKMSAAERGVLFNRLANLIEKHADELAQLESLDNGKPYHVARAADLP